MVLERESDALVAHLSGRSSRVTCALARVEVISAVRAQGRLATWRADRLLERISLLRLDDALLDEAAGLDGPTLRSLDAIHLAAAQAFRAGLAELITYDQRMTAAARQLGLPVAAPA